MQPQELAEVIRPGTGRGLDFVILDELKKRTGITWDMVFKWSLSEMLCNSLDTDASEIDIAVSVEDGLDVLTIHDNGSKKITVEDLKLILDFSNKASSKRGFKRFSRGYLGNALKCIFGYSYAQAEEKGLDPPPISVKSHGATYTIRLKPDRVREIIESEIVTEETPDAAGNTFTVKFPMNRLWTQDYFREITDEPLYESSILCELIEAAGIVNPTRRITYNLWDTVKGTTGEATETEELRRDTSILWYEAEQFTELVFDFMRVRPETQVKALVSLFRGFTSKKLHREILQQLNALRNHDSETAGDVKFFPATPLSELSKHDVETLYSIMRRLSKPISKRSIPKVLGLVGEDQFRKVKERRSWAQLKYTVLSDRKKPDYKKKATYPFLLELAVFDRDPEDKEGVKLYQCVNFMATGDSLFSRLFNIEGRLGQVGINENTPVTILVHLVCPVLEWLNYSKTYMGGQHIGEMVKKAFDKLLPIPKKPRTRKVKPPPKPVSWVPSGRIGNPIYEARLSDFARELKALDGQRSKGIVDKFSSRGWGYFLENLNKITKGEFNKVQHAINDCRKIGFIPIDFVAEDQDETRRFSGIHEASDPTAHLQDLQDDISGLLSALPSYTTDYWTGEKYYIMMCVEKGDIKRLFEPTCRKYKIPIVSSKGWPPILLRGHIVNLARKAEARGLVPVILLFYDHDPAGLKITNTFRKNLRDIERATGWDPSNLIIERVGLNEEDIDRYSLTWIENVRTSSGRRSTDSDYIFHYGRRKCESNALFKDDETLQAGLELCRNAIERYYGPDALQRFNEKETQSQASLTEIFDNPIWEEIQTEITQIINKFTEKRVEALEEPTLESEKVHAVDVNDRFYSNCPVCGTLFNDTAVENGTVFRCRECNTPLRLKQYEEGSLEF